MQTEDNCVNNDISVSGNQDFQVTHTNCVIEENHFEVIWATGGKSVEADSESQMLKMAGKKKRFLSNGCK